MEVSIDWNEEIMADEKNLEQKEEQLKERLGTKRLWQMKRI